MTLFLETENIIPALGIGTVAFLFKLESTHKVSKQLQLIAFVFSIIAIITIIALLTSKAVEPISRNITAGVIVSVLAVFLAVLSGFELYVKFKKQKYERYEVEK